MPSRFNLNKEKVGGGTPSTKLPPGEYTVRLEKQFLKDSENKQFKAGPYYISEFTVVKVHTGGAKTTDKHGNFYPDTKANDYRSWSNDMSHAQGPGSLNEFLCAVDGVDPKDRDAIDAANDGKGIDFDALYDDSVAAKNEMRGALVRVNVSLKKSGKDKQNEFMLNEFSVEEEQE